MLGKSCVFVIYRYRGVESNLRNQSHRIIERGHLEPWPKAFQNLRASRATDLVLHHPMHVVSEWTGQSIETLKKFYLQVTDEHREAALQVKPQLPPAASKDSDSQPLGEAKQNPKPSMPDMPRHAAQQKSQTPLITAFGLECLGLSGPSVAAEGLEQAFQTSQKPARAVKSEAKPEAVFVDGLPSVASLATWLSEI